LAEAQTPVGSAEELGYVAPSIERVLARPRTIALVKLRNRRCQQLFAEFRDLEGHPLEEVLTARGETAVQHLERMAFLDGFRVRPCGRKDVFAFTHTGDSEVFLCRSFGQLAQRAPSSAADLLIHEELHSLGAGEAPSPGLPTAYQITSQVEWRCRL